MIRHQDMGMERAPVQFRAVFEPSRISLILFIGEEDGLTVVPALDNMRRNAR